MEDSFRESKEKWEDGFEDATNPENPHKPPDLQYSNPSDSGSSGGLQGGNYFVPSTYGQTHVPYDAPQSAHQRVYTYLLSEEKRAIKQEYRKFNPMYLISHIIYWFVSAMVIIGGLLMYSDSLRRALTGVLIFFPFMIWDLVMIFIIINQKKKFYVWLREKKNIARF